MKSLTIMGANTLKSLLLYIYFRRVFPISKHSKQAVLQSFIHYTLYMMRYHKLNPSKYWWLWWPFTICQFLWPWFPTIIAFLPSSVSLWLHWPRLVSVRHRTLRGHCGLPASPCESVGLSLSYVTMTERLTSLSLLPYHTLTLLGAPIREALG